ncbi:MAG: hypothetical protein ACLPUG_09385 [Acidimicrobiales bacterium]
MRKSSTGEDGATNCGSTFAAYATRTAIPASTAIATRPESTIGRSNPTGAAVATKAGVASRSPRAPEGRLTASC